MMCMVRAACWLHCRQLMTTPCREGKRGRVAVAECVVAVITGTSSLPFPRTVPRRSLAPDAGSGQPLRTSQENMLMCTNGRLDIVRPDVR